jgi:hypothetical protein
MVFIVRQGDFQEGVSMAILMLGKETFKRASPWLFYCETRRISRGLFGHNGFYCEAKRLSRERLDPWLFYC